MASDNQRRNWWTESYLPLQQCVVVLFEQYFMKLVIYADFWTRTNVFLFLLLLSDFQLSKAC